MSKINDNLFFTFLSVIAFSSRMICMKHCSVWAVEWVGHNFLWISYYGSFQIHNEITFSVRRNFSSDLKMAQIWRQKEGKSGTFW